MATGRGLVGPQGPVHPPLRITKSQHRPFPPRSRKQRAPSTWGPQEEMKFIIFLEHRWRPVFSSSSRRLSKLGAELRFPKCPFSLRNAKK